MKNKKKQKKQKQTNPYLDSEPSSLLALPPAAPGASAMNPSPASVLKSHEHEI